MSFFAHRCAYAHLTRSPIRFAIHHVTRRHEINTRTGHNLDAEFDSLKQELVQLSNAAATENEKRQTSLESLQTDLDTLHSSDPFGFSSMKNKRSARERDRLATSKEEMNFHISELKRTHEKVLASLAGGGNTTFYLSMAAIVLILLAGLFLWQKFAKWEKKHIL